MCLITPGSGVTLCRFLDCTIETLLVPRSDSVIHSKIIQKESLSVVATILTTIWKLELIRWVNEWLKDDACNGFWKFQGIVKTEFKARVKWSKFSCQLQIRHQISHLTSFTLVLLKLIPSRGCSHENHMAWKMNCNYLSSKHKVNKLITNFIIFN